MKKYYTLLSLLLLSAFGFAQSYEFGIQHNGGYNFSIIATPDFDATDTDVSDIGFTLMLPAGSADVINESQFNGRPWGVTQATAAQLSGLGLGDGTRDAFVMNLPPGQTILSHSTGVSFTLVTFDISNMPMTGSLEILSNSDPIVMGLGGAADSFYNANIDMTTTQNYFGGLTAGMENFMFETLSIDEVTPTDFSIKVYPNPTKDIAFVSTTSDIQKIEVFDVTGKLVNTMTTKELDLSTLNAGLYFLKIQVNNQQIVKRLIKE